MNYYYKRETERETVIKLSIYQFHNTINKRLSTYFYKYENANKSDYNNPYEKFTFQHLINRKHVSKQSETNKHNILDTI